MEVSNQKQSSASTTNQWYTQLTQEILQALQDEIHQDSLHELKIRLYTDLELDGSTVTQAFSDDTELINIYDLLLNSTGSVYRTLSKLVQYSLDIVKDWPEELETKMETLRHAAIQQEVGMEGKLYGREDKLTELMSLMDFDLHADTKLINICGMPGIGKSFIVQHLRCRLISLNRIVIYVNCDEVKTIDKMLQKLLDSLNITMDAYSLSYLVGRLCDFLLHNKSDPFVLILDDITSLMDTARKSVKLVDLFDEILASPKMAAVKLKLVVTSQIHLRSKSEVEEQPWLSTVKRKIKKDWNHYTHDFPLEKLSNEDAVEFLGSALQGLSDARQLQMIRYCDGNPLALRMISELAMQDYTPTTEVSQASSDDFANAIQAEIFSRHRKAFSDLTDLQRHVLFAVVVFENEASLSALNYMVSPRESCLKFSNRIRNAFRGGFWLKFPVSNLKLGKSKNSEVVHIYHPRTREFLHKMVEEHQATYTELRRRYISYYINQLIDIGRECVPDETNKPDFVRVTCGRVLDNRMNFQRIFRLLETEDPCILFSVDGTSAKVRDSSDIAYLFLALCQFHDWFDGFLINTLHNIYVTDNVQHAVLLQTLYGMLLSVEESWTDLEVYLGPHNKLSNRKRIIEVSPGLYFLCEGLHKLTAATFFAHKAEVKVEVNSLVDKRKEAFEDACLNLGRLSKFWKPVQGYFTMRTLLAKAHSIYALNSSNLSTIHEAFALCQQAIDKCTEDHILRLTVDAKMANYKTAEGNAYLKESGLGDTAAAKESYNQAAFYFKTVSDRFRRRGMYKGLEAAQNYSKYADLLRSYGYVRAKNTKSESITNMFLLAERMGKKCIAILELHSYSSTYDLLTAYIHMGMCYRNLCKYHHEIPTGHTADDSDLLTGYQNQALKYYGLAYGLLLRDDYRKCHLKADDWRLRRVRNQLGYFMNLAGRDHESIDKVKENLDLIQNEVSRGAHELYLSGSDVYASTTDESDSFSSDGMEFEKITTSSQSTFTFTASASHSTQPDLQAAEQLNALELSRQGKKRKLID